MATPSWLRRWWDREVVRDRAEICRLVWARVDARTTTRRMLELRDVTYEGVYLGRPYAATAGHQLASFIVDRANPGKLLNINVTQSKIDAITSRASKHRVYPVIGVKGAKYDEGRHAREATAQLRARLKTSDVIRSKPRVHRASQIWGTGVLMARAEGGDITVEEVPRREIIVGDKDGATGAPRNYFRVYSLPLEVACYRWPKHWRELVRAAKPAGGLGDDAMYDAANFGDDELRVVVVTAHHLPSGPGAGDGRVVTCLRETLLEDREWARPRSPYAFWHWIPPVTGFWGQGLVEVLLGLQAEINDSARDIRENLRFGAALTIFKPTGSSIPDSHLVGRQPRVVTYDGQVPQYIAPMPVSPQQFQFFERLISLADDLSGLARDYSTGQTQLGANASGRAVQMLDDIQSDRFAAFLQGDTAATLDLGYAMFDEARDLAQRAKDGDLPEGVKLADWIREFDWLRCDPRKGYHLEFEPENFLPDTRSGRLAGINELGATGIIDDQDALLDSFDEPDMQRILHDKLGGRRAIQRVMSGLHDRGVSIFDLAPGAYFPLEKGIKMAQNEYNSAEAADAPAWLLDRIDQWIQLAKKRLDESKPPAPEQAPMPAGPPGGAVPPEMVAPTPPPDVPPELIAAGQLSPDALIP